MNDYHLALSILSKEPELVDVNSLPELHSQEDLENYLCPIIKYMLDAQFEKLIQIFYRIDLGEALVKKILSESDPENIALDFTKAIIERQLKKVYYRKKYAT